MLYLRRCFTSLIFLMLVIANNVYGGDKPSLSREVLPFSSAFYTAPHHAFSWCTGALAVCLIAHLSMHTVIGRAIAPPVDNPVTMELNLLSSQDGYYGSCTVICQPVCSPTFLAFTNDTKNLSCAVSSRDCADDALYIQRLSGANCPTLFFQILGNSDEGTKTINFTVKPTIDSPLNSVYMLCKHNEQFAYRPLPHLEALARKGLALLPVTHHSHLIFTPVSPSFEERPSLCKEDADHFIYLNQKNFVSCLKRSAQSHYKLSESIDFSNFSEVDKAAFPLDFGTPFNGSLDTCDYSIDNVFIRNAGANGFFKSLNHSTIWIEFGSVLISDLAIDVTKSVNVGLLASELFFEQHNSSLGAEVYDEYIWNSFKCRVGCWAYFW